MRGTGPQNDPAVKDDLHAAAAPAGIEKGVGEVALGVGTVEPDGLLGAGDDDGLAGVLDEVGHGGSCVRHRVRSVADHEAVVIVVILFQNLSKLQPVLRVHICAVNV